MSVPLYDISKFECLENSLRNLYSASSKWSRENVNGVDGVTINDYFQNKRLNFITLQKKIRKKNSYDFSPLLAVPRKKKNGKYRIICIPTVEDRLVQKTLLDNYLKFTHFGKFNGINYGFIKGKGIREATEQAVKYRKSANFVVKTDVSQFFDSIDRERLINHIRNRIHAKSLHTILSKAVCSEIDYRGDEVLKKIVFNNGIKDGVGVRQGMPLSPFVSNLYLYEFDLAIKEKNLMGIRYADDLIFFAKSKHEAETILDFCKNQLSKLSLSIPEIGRDSKTQIYTPIETVEFLGINIQLSNDKSHYIRTIPNKQIQNIKSRYTPLIHIDKQLSRNHTLTGVLKEINSITSAYISLYEGICEPSELINFKSLVNGLSVETKLSIYRNAFGIELPKLTKKNLRFLEIKD